MMANCIKGIKNEKDSSNKSMQPVDSSSFNVFEKLGDYIIEKSSLDQLTVE
jgi:hypothetical protein